MPNLELPVNNSEGLANSLKPLTKREVTDDTKLLPDVWEKQLENKMSEFFRAVRILRDEPKNPRFGMPACIKYVAFFMANAGLDYSDEMVEEINREFERQSQDRNHSLQLLAKVKNQYRKNYFLTMESLDEELMNTPAFRSGDIVQCSGVTQIINPYIYDNGYCVYTENMVMDDDDEFDDSAFVNRKNLRRQNPFVNPELREKSNEGKYNRSSLR